MSADLERWMTQLASRHMAELRFSEISRALRALSSTYVERRDTALAAGRALEGAGKRAAFALYYGPLHFVATQSILQALRPAVRFDGARRVIDLGCGTGAVGAAAALESGARQVLGIDVHPWALDEARATYAGFGLDGSVSRRSAAAFRPPTSPALIVAGYVANELAEPDRARLKAALLDAVKRRSQLLVIEPVSGRAAPWWPDWVAAFTAAGGRADTWTLTLAPPELTRRLGDAAGLTSTRATVRTLAGPPLGIQ